jgi:hypothetical protein
MKHMIATVVTLLALATGCTTYHQAGLSGGYRDKHLDGNRYQVSFFYNGPRAVFGGTDSVRRFLERRCAELTIEKGMKYFVIESEARSAVPMKLEYTIRLMTARTADDKVARDATKVLQGTSSPIHNE